MIKQSERVIRKGDYYEMQVVEDGFYSSKLSKREQSQLILPSTSDNIVTQLPSFKDARSNYYHPSTNVYSQAQPDQLLHQIQDILANQPLNDEDKQELLKMMRQIKQLKEQPLVPLTPLSKQKVKEREGPQTEVQLKVRLDLKSLQEKVEQLEALNYPEISILEHQLEILLGEKKTGTHSALAKDDRNKEEIDNLYSHFSGMTCLNNLPALASRIHANKGKHTQMAAWAGQLQNTTAFHQDFLLELEEDEHLLNELEKAFESNVEAVKRTISQLKEAK